eukprot:m.667376 g.667376  ORF g.667376 m.667376 type:complete len:125 (+) comp22752_c0_seq4:1157-1531(+)
MQSEPNSSSIRGDMQNQTLRDVSTISVGADGDVWIGIRSVVLPPNVLLSIVCIVDDRHCGCSVAGVVGRVVCVGWVGLLSRKKMMYVTIGSSGRESVISTRNPVTPMDAASTLSPTTAFAIATA